MLQKLRTFIQYFFQDMHSCPVDKFTAKNFRSLSTKTIKLRAITFKFAEQLHSSSMILANCCFIFSAKRRIKF